MVAMECVVWVGDVQFIWIRGKGRTTKGWSLMKENFTKTIKNHESILDGLTLALEKFKNVVNYLLDR